MNVAWTAWLLLMLGSFALLEAHAVQRKRMTLSRYVWNASRAWPPLPFVVGAVVGFLACHFWWGGPVCFGP